MKNRDAVTLDTDLRPLSKDWFCEVCRANPQRCLGCALEHAPGIPRVAARHALHCSVCGLCDNPAPCQHCQQGGKVASSLHHWNPWGSLKILITLFTFFTSTRGHFWALTWTAKFVRGSCCCWELSLGDNTSTILNLWMDIAVKQHQTTLARCDMGGKDCHRATHLRHWTAWRQFQGIEPICAISVCYQTGCCSPPLKVVPAGDLNLVEGCNICSKANCKRRESEPFVAAARTGIAPYVQRGLVQPTGSEFLQQTKEWNLRCSCSGNRAMHVYIYIYMYI